MIKKAIIFVMPFMMFAVPTAPIYGMNEIGHQESESNHESEIADTRTAKLLNEFKTDLDEDPITTTVYATTAVNIQKSPSADSEIIGQSSVNTQIEVVAEIGGWAMVMVDNDYAYIKADWLNDTPITEKTYTDEDLKILAMILCGECQNYPDQEQRLVGSVFLNRVKSDQFPNTFQGVAADRRYGIQYACWYDGNAFREIQQSNWDNAKWLLENGSILPDEVLYQSGRRMGKVYTKTKWHYYCY